MRVGIVGIMNESNTFIHIPTDIEDFEKDLLLVGDQIRKRMTDAHHEVAGFLQTLDAAGVEAVPLMFARALPGGTITARALDYLLTLTFEQLDKAGPLDGLLTAPHGANVSEDQPDMDGYWLALLRQRVGKNVPIITTLDLHANLSQRAVDAVDAIVPYRTNPHLDQRQRGCDAANLMVRTLRGEIRPTVRGSFPPVAINIERQNPSAAPCKTLYDRADQMLKHPRVLANGILLSFAYSDVQQMGTAFTVTTDNDPQLAQSLSDELASMLIENPQQFVGQFIDARDAVAQAMTPPGPVCLLDMGDNVGGGSPGDGALIAREFESYVQQHAGAAGKQMFICLFDEKAAASAIAAGPGATLRLQMGGKLHPLYGDPLDAEVTVLSVHEGKFTESQVRHYGMTHFDMGPTAIVRTARGCVVQLTSRRVYPTSLNQLLSCNIDPSQFQILVAKGVHAPVAAYAPVSKQLIRVNTPGVTCADMRQLPFNNRRRPLYPFEEISEAASVQP